MTKGGWGGAGCGGRRNRPGACRSACRPPARPSIRGFAATRDEALLFLLIPGSPPEDGRIEGPPRRPRHFDRSRARRGAAEKSSPRGNKISPLRFAPVEMTREATPASGARRSLRYGPRGELPRTTGIRFVGRIRGSTLPVIPYRRPAHPPAAVASASGAGRLATTSSIRPNSLASSGDRKRSRSIASSMVPMSWPVCST